MLNNIRTCQTCGHSERPADEFADGTGYQCSVCLSNVFYVISYS